MQHSSIQAERERWRRIKSEIGKARSLVGQVRSPEAADPVGAWLPQHFNQYTLPATGTPVA